MTSKIEYYTHCVDRFTDAFDELVHQYSSVSNPPTKEELHRVMAAFRELDNLYRCHEQKLADDGLTIEDSYLFGAWLSEAETSIESTRNDTLIHLEKFLDLYVE